MEHTPLTGKHIFSEVEFLQVGELAQLFRNVACQMRDDRRRDKGGKACFVTWGP